MLSLMVKQIWIGIDYFFLILHNFWFRFGTANYRKIAG